MPSPVPAVGPHSGPATTGTGWPGVLVRPLRRPALNSCGRKAVFRGRAGGGPRPPAAVLRLVPSTWSAERPAWPGWGPQGKSGGPHTWRPHKTFAGQAPGPPWDPVPSARPSISQLGLGVFAPRGGRGEQRPWGHLGTHALPPLFSLSGPQPGRGIFLPLGHTWDKHHLLREPSPINLAS